MNFHTTFIDKLLSEPSWRHLCMVEAEQVVAGDPPQPAPNPDEPEIEIEEEPAAAAAELDELDIGPDKIKVDKRVKVAWDSLQKSAQTKAEEAAKERAEVATERGRIAEQARIFAAVQDQVLEIKTIDSQIGPYQKLTPQEWIAWGQQDAEAANKAMQAVNALQLRKNQLMGAVEATVKDTQARESLAAQVRAQEADKAVAAAFKDWSPARRQQLEAVATAHGFRTDELSGAFQDPRVLGVLDKARKWDAAVAKAAGKKVAPAAGDPPAAAAGSGPAPLTSVRGNTGPKGGELRDSMPIEQWAKQFTKQRRGK